MSWLFPLYLLGAGAILAPILMHLRRRPPQERVEFSSLMFLQAQTPLPVSKRRIEHWLLLLLRCLALLLLALMFARPWLHSDARAAAGAGKVVLILVDRSASMQRSDLMAQALDRARAEVLAADSQDWVALAAFDATLQPLWTFEQDAGATGRAALLQQLADIRPGWQATDLGRSLVDALGLLTGSSGLAGREQRLVVVTDLQEGARLDALRGIAWPEQVPVRLLRVETSDAANFSLSLAAAAEDSAAASLLRVRVARAREADPADFTLRWEKAGGEPLTGHLPAGATRLLSLPLPDKLADQGDVLRLDGDAHAFDNRLFIAPAPPRAVTVAWLGPSAGAEEASSPLYYLQRALQPTPALQPRVIREGAAGLADARLAVLHGAPPPAELGDWLRAGGFAVWLLEPGTRAGAIEALAGLPGFTVEEAVVDGYRMLGEVKSEHALLRPFADARLRDFTKLRFWKHRRVSLDGEAAQRTEVLARFDNGDPALLALPVGSGTLLLLSSGWQPADSQLALSTKFVPLLFGWLEAAGFAHGAAAGLSVGDALPAAEGAATVVTPEGGEVAVPAGARHRAESIGVYQVKSGGRSHWHAVNLAPAEGRTTPLAVERLADFGLRLEAGSGTAAEAEEVGRVQERLAAGEAEERQQAWLWILAGLLAVLGAETWLAGRTTRPERTAAVPT